MRRWNTSLPQTLFDTPRTPSTKTIPAAGRESLQTTFDHFRPGSQQDQPRTSDRTPTGTQGGPRWDSPQGHQQPAPEKTQERPGKGRRKARRGPNGPDQPDPTKPKGKARGGHPRPTRNPPPSQPPPQEPTSNQPTARKARKGPREATDRASGTRPPPHHRGQGKAQERPEKRPPREANPVPPLVAVSCRRLSNGYT